MLMLSVQNIDSVTLNPWSLIF